MPVPEKFPAAVVPKPRAQNIISERTLQPLKPGEVAIKITATAINPVDWKMRDYDAFISEYPAVLGSDAAGVIVDTAPDVSSHDVGDRVFFQGIVGNYDSSTFQQYCKMPAVLVSKTPNCITDEQAAGVSLATVAAVTAFYDKQGHGMIPPWEPQGHQVGNGKAIVIIGGGSSVGQYAIQLARLSGFSRIITNASPANHAFLERLGAHVVLHRAHCTAADFNAAISGLPLEMVFDAISIKSTQVLSVQIIQCKRTAGDVVTVHVVNPETVDPDAAALSRSTEQMVEIKQVLGLGSSPELRYLSEPMVKHLGGEDGCIARRLFIPNRVRVIPGGLRSVEAALASNKNGVSGEKIVFKPCEE
ncbi:hypothetical protein ASPWEDRAFT_38640 [Aspergillus wentii DTO 134E9]|uniref:Enoyl reductase (ER) domain-containing protein n=1 Tax=Aspergillus wentii DTO 134E9 TaxID=1073089 RepID=A0A1L9RPW7_ASPWE|nr:uncharacterized protein ASPWEDRAFT_38640 [Aspergillus wentii DTO 134E9]OJJ37000.1 hypothetical protein ASPWEDRAFT_38640 [Aspergillus wentii DTO 134E9]